MSFADFNLHQNLKKQLKALRFEAPTPIQQQAIGPILEQKDVIGLAQTGTGKTAAFVLPILQKIHQSNIKRGVQALVLAPTRELAEQIHEVFNSFGKTLNIHSAAIFGGVGYQPQVNALRNSQVVVACPGRLLDHLGRRTMNLSGVQTLVLDEADQMLDMGFLPAIRKVIEALPTKRQTLLFSATMPQEIEKLTRSIQHKPVKIEVARQKVSSQVAHSLFRIHQQKKADLLSHLIEQDVTSSTLVFTRTKFRAKRLAEKLKKQGYKATSLHGNLSINQRRQAMAGFKKGKYHIMVATDIAARGIDIASITKVINFDVPVTADIYVHRIGRTGRAANTGVAYTFASSEEMKIINQVEKKLKSKLPVEQHAFG